MSHKLILSYKMACDAMLLDIAYRSSESKSTTIAMSSYLKRIIGCFDTTLEIFKPFFSLDTWTLGHSV